MTREKNLSMTRKLPAAAVSLSIAALAACASGGGRLQDPGVAMTPVAKNSLTLEAANRRWAGARCELRYWFSKIRKKPDREGWFHGPWVRVTGVRTKFGIKVSLSDPESFAPFYSDRTLQAGARLVSRGWKLDGRHPYLELAHERGGAYMRVDFTQGLERLAEIEQFTRMNVFQLQAADEELLDVRR